MTAKDLKVFRIGFIGAGTHANNMLYPALNFIDDYIIERTAICDLIEEKAIKTAGMAGIKKIYTNHLEMLEKEKLDGVVICINGIHHPKITIDCLKAGVDVFVEKPTSATIEESEEILKVSKETGRFVMVDHQKRRSAAYKRALDIVKRPEFGRIIMINSKMHGHSYESFFNCFLEWQIHNIDIVHAFGGPVKDLTAKMCRLAENRAAITVLLEFESGAVGTLNWGTEAGWGRFCERVEVAGSNTEGVIVENVRKVIHYKNDVSTEWAPNWIPISAMQTHVMDGYVPNLIAFMDSVFDRTVPVPGIEDELRNLRVIHKITEQLGLEKKYTVTIGDR